MKIAQTYVIVALFKLKVKRRDVWGVVQSHLGLCMRDWSVKKMAKMAENKMAQVAAMFDKKLGEEFAVRTQDRPKMTVSIRENGVFTQDGKRTIWILERLLTGESEIVEE